MNRQQRRHIHALRQERLRKLFEHFNPRRTFLAFEDWGPRQWAHDNADWNPPSSYGKQWRSQYRAACKHAMTRCRDFDTLQFFKHQKVTSIYDWY